MKVIAIDGACRRNGKADCVSAGACFIIDYNRATPGVAAEVKDLLVAHEYSSTSQRGELTALTVALQYLLTNGLDDSVRDAVLITDSEYIFNALKNQWYVRWEASKWRKADGEPAKNADMWRTVAEQLHKLAEADYEITPLHVKGHVMPFGAVTASKLLEADSTGAALYREALAKLAVYKHTNCVAVEEAQELSRRNNGFRLTDWLFMLAVSMNTVVDAAAKEAAVKADYSRKI